MGFDPSSTEDVAERLTFIGFAFLVVYGALVVVPFAFLALGVTVAGWMVPLALVGAALALYFLATDNRIRDVGVALGIVGAVLLIAVPVALTFFDASVDGRGYHQTAVISLSNGWNPISDAYPGVVTGVDYVRSYPKAFWIASAALFELFDSIEVGKSLHVLPLGASFFITLALLIRMRFRVGVAVVGAGLAAANPVWILQSLSFYVDGQSASLILVAVAAGVWSLRFTTNRIVTGSLAISLILLINLKFTGLYYAGLILLALGAALMWQRRWPELRNLVGVYGVVLAIAVGVVGFNPYVQNTLDFGNPLFPVYGEGSVDFITANTPINLRGASQPVQLLYGIFGEPADSLQVRADLAVPFSPANLSDKVPYSGIGARIAGLGPFFSGALLLAAAGTIWYLVRERRKPARLLVSLTLVFLAITVVAHPEGWWARYTPQLWFIPVVVILGAWAIDSWDAKWVGAVLSFALVANLYFVIQPYLESNMDFTRGIRRMYAPFVERSEVMAVRVTRFGESTVEQMREAGVDFELYAFVDDLPCLSPKPMTNEVGQYCPLEAPDLTG